MGKPTSKVGGHGHTTHVLTGLEWKESRDAAALAERVAIWHALRTAAARRPPASLGVVLAQFDRGKPFDVGDKARSEAP